MNKKVISIAFIFLLVILSPKSIFASARSEVLGDFTNTNLFPPVAAGTGFLLPDSPIYFVDKIFQNFKLALAFTPQNKAATEGQILGERLAELRVMHASGNKDGINTALLEIEKEAKNAAYDLKVASANGEDVSQIAKQVNDYLKDYRNIIAVAADNSSEELSLKLESTNLSLLSSKVDVDEFLNQADKDDAIQSDLESEVETAVLGQETRSLSTEKKLGSLEKRASKAAELQAKKDTVKKLLEVKKTENKKLLEEKKKLQDQKKKLLEERKKKMESAREALKKVREAAKSFREAKKAENELKSQNEQEVHPSVTPEQKSSTETETHSSDSNSGSGSSNSGSGSSGSSNSGGKGGDDK